MDITQKPLEDITWADIEALVSNGVEEGPFLDFKSGLLFDTRKSGKDAARDKVCKELVAFANTYGGTVVAGVTDEGDVAASLDPPVTDVASAAENLGRALRSGYIDPPIAGLQVRPIDRGDGSGVIVLRVPNSPSAPHGFGSPPACYVRAEKNSRPMTMRDMQSVFWDARTRQERVAQMRQEARAEMVRVGPIWVAHELADIPLARPSWHISEPGISFRMTAIPQHPLPGGPPNSDWIRQSLRPRVAEFGADLCFQFGEGYFDNLRRRPHGYVARRRGTRDASGWVVMENGMISVAGFMTGMPDPSREGANKHHPDWFADIAAQIIVMADRMRCRQAAPEAVFEVDFEMTHDGTAEADFSGRRYGMEGITPMLRSVRCDPMVLDSADQFGDLFDELRKTVWAFFGYEQMQQSRLRWPARL